MVTDVRTRPVVPPMLRRRRTVRRRRLVMAVTLLVVVPGLTVLRTYAHDVDRGVHVLGLDLGGKSRAEALQVLERGVAGRLHQPVAVKVGTEPAVIDPAAVGLTLDAAATIDRAVAATPAPFTDEDVAPVVHVDAGRLYAALMDHLGAQGDAPVMPAVRFDGLKPIAVYPEPGRGLDRTGIARLAETGWLRRPALEFPVADLLPKDTRADVDRLIRDLATPAVAGPLVLATPRGEVTVTASGIAGALRLESDADGHIVPALDAAALRKSAAAAFAKVEVPAADARFEVVGGRPVIRAETDGSRVDLSTPKLLEALRSTATPRRVTVPMTSAPAATTAAELGKLGVSGPAGSFTTHFEPGQPRVVNIRTMAEALRGMLIRPGETFSLNERVGERTHAKGYVDAPGIEMGKIKNSSGGGVSQVATTLFNAAYLAGLQDVEHHPHSYYFDRYPAVIEATVVYPSLDLRIRNDGPSGVLIDTATTDDSVTVTLYGTKRYDIATVYGPRTKIVQPKTEYLQEADCNPTAGAPGFTQEAYRVFSQDGHEVRRERFTWRYDPEPHFICGAPPPGAAA
ncbi:VanW family protein [Dactylosporangium vinaceum]|uniref:VanW family protein n=1 Tax=Dactylosporangium vinaceum TaxID=53362 RepID=A0ABV5MJG4_9ACTN|nr:VanW family protein [Dactylosporangium vinaceum]UAB93577.1 VanW family protein [Dactylosporangium vinaceum]